jgi:AcrR family transcriptional regulator
VAARKLFIERGFDRTTVRDIAGAAGVNQALLFRYFGSKEALFADAMTGQSEELLADTPAAELVAQVLARLFGKDVPSAGDSPLHALLRSGANEQTAVLFRDHLGARYRDVLATLTDAADADLRADLVLAWLLGLALLKQVLDHQPLSEADPGEVSALVLRAVATLLERVDQTPRQCTGPGD